MAKVQQPIKLLVGLGNPGPEYHETRHNAGFWFLDQLANQSNLSFSDDKKFHGQWCKAPSLGMSLLKPMTFMNRSGQSVGAICQYFKVPIEQVLVVHDELDLPPGEAKLKFAGGHGGHNGLRDIIAHCGANFWRLRVGIGHPGHKSQVVNFVLNRASLNEQTSIQAALDESLSIMGWLQKGEFSPAMNQLHQKRT